MAKATATLFLGLTMGLIGMMIYNRVKESEANQNPEFLLDRICDHLVDLELARADVRAHLN